MELYYIEKTERQLESPLGAPRITEQPRRHGSSERYTRDPVTQGYRPGGLVGHVARYEGNRLGAQDRSSLFLTILFGRTVIALQTPPVTRGACRSCGTIPRKSSRSPGPFLIVSRYTIRTHGHSPL